MMEIRRLLEESSTVTRMKFSPLALKIDRFASQYDKDSFLGCFLRAGARFASLILPHIMVDVNIATDEEVSHRCIEHCLPLHAGGSLDYIMEGHITFFNVQNQAALLALILWRLHYSKNFLEVYTAMKRASPYCKITVDEAIMIPMAYAKFCEFSYMPERELLAIEHSILRPR